MSPYAVISIKMAFKIHSQVLFPAMKCNPECLRVCLEVFPFLQLDLWRQQIHTEDFEEMSWEGSAMQPEGDYELLVLSFMVAIQNRYKARIVSTQILHKQVLKFNVKRSQLIFHNAQPKRMLILTASIQHSSLHTAWLHSGTGLIWSPLDQWSSRNRNVWVSCREVETVWPWRETLNGSHFKVFQVNITSTHGH